MNKLSDKAKEFLEKYKCGGQKKAQRGIGFSAYDPFGRSDRQLDVLKAAGASYLSAYTRGQGIYNYLMDDPEAAAQQTRRSAAITGVLGGVNAGLANLAERRNYERELRKIAETKADEYYRLPYDRYGYNEQTNAFNNTAYKKGGKVKSMQAGGQPDSFFVKQEAQKRLLNEYVANPNYDFVNDRTSLGSAATDSMRLRSQVDPFYRGDPLHWRLTDFLPTADFREAMYASQLRDITADPSVHKPSKQSWHVRERKLGGPIGGPLERGHLPRYQDGGLIPLDYGGAGPAEQEIDPETVRQYVPEVYDSTEQDARGNGPSFRPEYAVDDDGAMFGFDAFADYQRTRSANIDVQLLAGESQKSLQRARVPSKNVSEMLSLLMNKYGIKPSSITSGKHNVGSKHYQGKAFDLGLNTSFGGDLQKMHNFRDEFLRLRRVDPLFMRFDIHDETVRPKGQREWSGAHLHIAEF